MNFENEARYLIVDNFDKIKNKIDINVESLLLCNNSLNDEARIKLNEIREEQILKIEEVQQASLNNLLDFSTKFTQQTNESLMFNNNGLIIERTLSSCILNDLILVQSSNLKYEQVLYVVSRHLNSIKYKLLIIIKAKHKV